ncbi:MAG TPA: hypothetical protein DCG57_07915 [Candidatus Riflebacteria bacterium]|nr:hypothetical protein [Candidatus Riflebacteria bacterium]
MKILRCVSVKRLLLLSLLASMPVLAAGQTTSQARQLNSADLKQIIGELQVVSSELDQLLAMSGDDSTTSTSDVTVVKGDYLSALARKHLGSASRWPELVAWNQDRYPSLLKNPDLIHIGWKLRMAPPSAAKTSNNAPASTKPISLSSARTANTASFAPATSTSARSSTANSASTSAGTTAGVAAAPGGSLTSRAVPAGVPIIKSNSTVLHIGDSHACGTYGKAIDEMMRETGATVNTIGVSGSSPSWWFNGTVGKSGYYAKDENGRVDQPADWRTPRATPNLKTLIKEKKPDVLVVSLGANLIGGSDAAIINQVRSICQVARENNTQLVWVGPPDGREDKKSTAAQTRLYLALKSAVSEYGATFIDSRPYTEYPTTGGDGVHYSGTEGSRIAKEWAKSVYNTIQGK